MLFFQAFWINVIIIKSLGVGVQTVMGLGWNQFTGIQDKGRSPSPPPCQILRARDNIPLFLIPVCKHAIWTEKEASLSDAWRRAADKA